MCTTKLRNDQSAQSEISKYRLAIKCVGGEKINSIRLCIAADTQAM